jgi:hypothetical protein
MSLVIYKNVFSIPTKGYKVISCLSHDRLIVNNYTNNLFIGCELFLTGLPRVKKIHRHAMKQELEKLVLGKNISLYNIEGIDFYDCVISTGVSIKHDSCNFTNLNLTMSNIINSDKFK